MISSWLGKVLVLVKKVLLYDSQLRLFLGKLSSRWIDPFVVTNIFDHGAKEIHSLDTGKTFKLNGHRLQPFYKGFKVGTIESIDLEVSTSVEKL